MTNTNITPETVDLRTEKEIEIEHRRQKVEKMFTFLRGLCASDPKKFYNTSRALGFTRDKHDGQLRKSGEPYIIHPLSIACDAVGMSLTDDVLLATLILHDVPEDTNTPVMDLPVDEEVKRAVECLTIRYEPGVSKLDVKRAYYEKLRGNKYATLGKGFDRRDNLSTMAGNLEKKAIVKNIYETKYFLQPLLKEAKNRWPEYSGQLHTVRTDIRGYLRILSFYCEVDLPRQMPDDSVLKLYFS